MARILKTISTTTFSPEAEETLNNLFSGADDNHELKRMIKNFSEYGGEEVEADLPIIAEDLKNMRMIDGEIYFKASDFHIDTIYMLATAIAHVIETGRFVIEIGHNDNQPDALFLIENGEFSVFSEEYCYEF